VVPLEVVLRTVTYDSYCAWFGGVSASSRFFCGGHLELQNNFFNHFAACVWKPYISPQIVNPHFSKTRREAILCFATWA